jgi:hypothetical protein
MKRLVLFAVVLAALSITSQVSDAAKLLDQYLCVTEKRIGFVDDNRLDAESAATVQAVKNFLISTASPQDPDFVFLIVEAGEPFPSGYCEYGLMTGEFFSVT